jgi:hypothetical protein
VSIDNAEFEARRRLPHYRVGIWLYRLIVATFLVTVALRPTGVLRTTPAVSFALMAVVLAAVVVARIFFTRAGVKRSTPQGEQVTFRAPWTMILRDVFWLGRR